MNKHFLKILIIVLTLSVFFIAQTALAQDIGAGDSGWLKTIAGQGFFKTDSSITNDSFLETFIGQLIGAFLGLLGILFICFIIYSGIQWMTAGGDEEKIKNAKTRIKNAVLGLALVFFSFIIANTVFTFFFQQGGFGPEAQTCNVDADCPEGLVCQGGICRESEEPGNVRCRENADCPRLQPVCKSFLHERVNIKWCSCEEGRCPPGHFCQQRALRTNICVPNQ